MRAYLEDITFLILVRLDSITRLENIILVTEQLCKYFNTNIMVRNADRYDNGFLKALLNKKIYYEFVEDKDPVLYKTKHFNQMTLKVNTTYIAIWDADIIVDVKSVMDCMEKLREDIADIAYPYNGICYDIPDIIKAIFFKKKDIRFLFKNKNKMDKLYPRLLVGGAVLMNKSKYSLAGMENEQHYGWGNDDFDRYYRFVGLGYKIYNVSSPLFHLSHTRNLNSQFRSHMANKISFAAMSKIENSSVQELLNKLK